MKRTQKRTVTGCLTCRRRKQKCDEQKPICSGCQRNFLQCQWPDYSSGRIRKRRKKLDNPATDPDSEIQQGSGAPSKLQFVVTTCDSKKFLKCGQQEWQFEVYSKDNRTDRLCKLDNQLQIFAHIAEFPKDDDTGFTFAEDASSLGISDDANQNLRKWGGVTNDLDLQLSEFQTIDIPLDALVLHPSTYASEPQYHALEDPTSSEAHVYEEILQRYNNGELLDDSVMKDIDTETLLFYACLNGFIAKLKTQYTQPTLSADATFVPQVERNYFMRQVFLCCGATYLAWKDLERFQQLSDELYLKCKTMIQDYMKNNSHYADEDWLFAALQLLCNRDKNSFYGSVDDSVWHLAQTYDIINKRYGNRKLHTDNPVLDHLTNTTLILQPHERMFIECFIYHYSISVLLARDISSLPNPFVIFKELNVVLKCPVYNSAPVVEWMNNPLLGSSLDTLEILAKISYIGRMEMPLGPLWLEKLVRLRNMCIYYTPAMHSTGMDELQWFNFKINSLVGILMTKSCYLLASKMIHYNDFDINSIEVRKCLKELLRCFREIPQDHTIWGILPWPMLITGAFARDPDDQELILQRINLMAERAHTYCGVRMASFLHEIWNSKDSPDSGLSLLFDRERLAQLDL